MRGRLSVLMAAVYAGPAAVIPLMSSHLGSLGFDAAQVGVICATQAVAALFAPLVAGQLADRWLRPERCLALLGTLSAGLFLLVADLTDYLSVLVAAQVLWLAAVPTMTVCSAVCFALLDDPDRDFGPVRMWGTAGWVAVNLSLGVWLSEPAWLAGAREWLRPGHGHAAYSDALRFAAGLELLLAAYALSLPSDRARRAARLGDGSFAPLAAARLLGTRGFLVYAACLFGACLTLAYTTQLTPLLLTSLGLPRSWLAPTMTISQASEVLMLFSLPAVLGRVGVRGSMRAGLAAWLVAMLVLAGGGPLWLVVLSMALNGVCIACFFVAGQVYVNRRATPDLRASVQSMLTMVSGCGLLTGNLSAGLLRQLDGGGFGLAFGAAALVALTLLAAFTAGFPAGEGERPDEEPAAPVGDVAPAVGVAAPGPHALEPPLTSCRSTP